MSTPLVPTYRIQAEYTVPGLPPHHSRHYVLPGVGSPSTIAVLQQSPLLSIDWKLAAQGLADAIAIVLGVGTSIGPFLMEHLTGVNWNPIFAFTPTFTPGAGTPLLAWQLTTVVRDTQFRQVRLIAHETVEDELFHFASYPTGATNLDNYLKQWTNLFSVSNAPWGWEVSRAGLYLQNNGISGVTNAPNRHLRRRRGLV